MFSDPREMGWMEKVCVQQWMHGACIPMTLGAPSWGGLGTLGRDLLRMDSKVQQVRDTLLQRVS